jgi:hypothetical protein
MRVLLVFRTPIPGLTEEVGVRLFLCYMRNFSERGSREASSL